MSRSSDDANEKSWAVAVLLAWLVPGLGHWYLGRRGKALAFFGFIAGLFLVGWGFGQFKVVCFGDTWLFIGQALGGVLSIFTGYVGDILRNSSGPPDPVPVMYESGVVYTLVAGLLNLLVMLDAYIVANRIRRPTHPEPDAEPEGE